MEDAADIYLITHSHWEPDRFELPALPTGCGWYRFVDTSRGPESITDIEAVDLLPNQSAYDVAPRSTVVLIAKGTV